MTSSDEIEYLKSGLKKATAQLQAKDAALQAKNAALLQIKANASEYAKAFKDQTQEFQSLKDQLVDAQDALARKDEDLKYKDLALARLKMMSKGLNERISVAEKNIGSKQPHTGTKIGDLQMELKRANMKIKALQDQLNQLGAPSDSVMEQKLKQALDKINEQGRIISALAQKLQDAGKSVDLSKI
jgi:hypothetical protein